MWITCTMPKKLTCSCDCRFHGGSAFFYMMGIRRHFVVLLLNTNWACRLFTDQLIWPSLADKTLGESPSRAPVIAGTTYCFRNAIQTGQEVCVYRIELHDMSKWWSLLCNLTDLLLNPSFSRKKLLFNLWSLIFCLHSFTDNWMHQFKAFCGENLGQQPYIY